MYFGRPLCFNCQSCNKIALAALVLSKHVQWSMVTILHSSTVCTYGKDTSSILDRRSNLQAGLQPEFGQTCQNGQNIHSTCLATGAYLHLHVTEDIRS